MDRNIVWPGAIPLETDLLNTNKNAMVSIAKLAAALLGSGTTINGLSCGATAPASLQVSVGAGEIYALKNIDDTAYSSLAADTTHQILKQGILLDAVTLSCPAPGTTGQSINYLVQAAFAETDTNATVLPFYNASNPSQAWNGPNNSGSTSVTTRADQCVVTVKAGTAATTGSQTTPSPDSGNVGLYVVTVAYGQTTITAGNISTYSGNPSVPSSGIASALHNALYAKSVAGGSDVTLTTQEAANPIIGFSGTLSANINVIVPAASHQWIVSNNTSGAYSLTVKTAAGTGILIPQGQSMILYCDGVNVIAAGAANQSSFTPTPFTATAGQTVFTVGYTPGNITVVKNGSTLSPSAFTATNGSSITLATACNAGDVVVVYAFTSFTVANALTQATGDLRYLQLAGGTLTGPLTLAGNPTNNLHAAPKQYVDSAIATVQGAFKNLVVSATGLNANVSVSADEIVVENGSNQYQALRSVSLTIAGTTTGANALDTGTIATSTWYSLWVIWNGTTTAGLLSLSTTAPTLPSGYTHKARVGWIRTDSTANKYPLSFKQYGRRVQYSVAAGSNVAGLPLMASGAAGSTSTPTWVAVAVGNFVPSTASAIKASLMGNGVTGIWMAAPNSSYGAIGSASNPPQIAFSYPSGNLANDSFAFEMSLESSNIYWASSAAGYLSCIGWEDNL